MKILFIHQNFPGQFRHLAAHLARLPGYEALAIGRETAPNMPNSRIIRYTPHRQPGKETHPYARQFENAVLHGQEVLRKLLDIKQRGLSPDVVVAHPGWGESLYVKLAFPQARLVHFCEFYYHLEGADAGFDPEFPLTPQSAATIVSRNAMHLLNLEHCDVAIAPTHWQKSLFPAAYQDKIRVIHEGIDVEHLGPDPEATLDLPNGTTLRAGEPIVTYVARNLEPYRGFHRFMRALPKILKKHPSCQAVIVGGDDVSYGGKPKDARNWREKMLAENPVDPARVHFLGKVDYERYKRVLQVSAAHVYLTYPFVLSWSLLEALASGCLVVASDTAPVREAIEDGENGLLVGFFDEKALVERVVNALNNPQGMQRLRAAARESVQEYSVARGIEGYLNAIK